MISSIGEHIGWEKKTGFWFPFLFSKKSKFLISLPLVLFSGKHTTHHTHTSMHSLSLSIRNSIILTIIKQYQPGEDNNLWDIPYFRSTFIINTITAKYFEKKNELDLNQRIKDVIHIGIKSPTQMKNNFLGKICNQVKHNRIDRGSAISMRQTFRK